jgi:hypothetical protein
MTTTMITIPVLLALAVGVLAAAALIQRSATADFSNDGISCQSCMDTGYAVGLATARACKAGCTENRESPYWPLVNAYLH